MKDSTARHYMRMSSPRTPQIHLIESALGGHLFVADGSRLFDADAELFMDVRALARNKYRWGDGLPVEFRLDREVRN